MDNYVALQFAVLIILLILSAFFSSAETALTTVNRIRIRNLAEDKESSKKEKISAERVMKITDDEKKMLSAILIGNNIVNLSAASLTTAIAYQLGGSMVAIASAILTVFIILFGEITPKTLATIHSERISLMYSGIISLFMKVMTPLIVIINALSSLILRLLGVDPNKRYDVMTESELRTIVDVSHEDGVIEKDEKEMINNVFDLGDAKAKDVMIPRVHMVSAEINSTYEELLAIFRENKFTRLPIYSESSDNVVGVLNMKDLLLYDASHPFSVEENMRDAHYTYEYKNISELLVEMRKASIGMSIVLDEYGETAGLITLEDILEEIVGEIHDEYDDNEEELIDKIGPGEYSVEGAINLEDLNDKLDLDLYSEDYDSVGGFIIEHLDRLPRIGDSFTTKEGIRMVVEKMDRNRVERVHVTLPK